MNLFNGAQWADSGCRRTRRGYFVLLAASTILCLMINYPISAASEITKKVDGRVIRVNAPANMFAIEYEHPATGEHIEQEFLIDEHTRLKNVKSLEKLKKDAIITVDYRVVDGKAKAFYVDLVLTQVQYVKPEELAALILKMKPEKK